MTKDILFNKAFNTVRIVLLGLVVTATLAVFGVRAFSGNTNGDVYEHVDTINNYVDGGPALGGTFTTPGTDFNDVRVTGELQPGANATYDLGAYGAAWNDIYVSGTAYLVATSFTGDLDPQANNTYDLGGFGTAWNDVFSSGTAYLTNTEFSGNLLPSANNTYDIGAYGTAWQSIYTSSTIFVPDIHDLLYIDSVNGRVGVATSTPASLVDVYSSATSTVSIDSNSASQGGCLKIRDVDGGGYSYGTVLDGAVTWSTVSCE